MNVFTLFHMKIVVKRARIRIYSHSTQVGYQISEVMLACITNSDLKQLEIFDLGYIRMWCEYMNTFIHLDVARK